MANIFLSYRRGGTRADTGRIYDRLSAHFGEASVFMDIDDIEPGENFVHKLETTLAACDVMLIIMGSHWVDACSDDGKPRLGAEGDFVSLEVQQALERGISIIPVLVGGATMPTTEQLPAELAGLSQHQAIEISDQRFHEDVSDLIEAIERRFRSPRSPARKKTYLLSALAILVLGSLLAFFMAGGKEYSLRSESTLLSVAQAKATLVKHGMFDVSWNAGSEGLENQLETLLINDDLLILDHSTDLIWQKSGSAKMMTLDLAQDYIRSLNKRRFADQGDWRLPTYEEAMSLMESEKYGNFYIEPIFEAAAAPFVFTADQTAEGKSWVVYYYDGRSQLESKRFNASVRAVRTNR